MNENGVNRQVTLLDIHQLKSLCIEVAGSLIEISQLKRGTHECVVDGEKIEERVNEIEYNTVINRAGSVLTAAAYMLGSLAEDNRFKDIDA